MEKIDKILEFIDQRCSSDEDAIKKLKISEKELFDLKNHNVNQFTSMRLSLLRQRALDVIQL